MKQTKDADGNSPFSSCLIDACNNDGAKLKKVTCPALEEFEEVCVENGYAPPEANNWRNITSCREHLHFIHLLLIALNFFTNNLVKVD